MGNRMLRDWTNSDKVDSVSCEAERFFTRLIMKADDHGCFWGDAKRLKANLYPLKSDSIREADILRWKAECQKAGLIVVYESEGRDYVQIIDFDQRLRLRKQKFPLPDQSVSGKDAKSEAYVYFIASKNDDSVKIGFSLNPWARVKELSTGSHHSLAVIGAFKGLMEDEKEIHSILKTIRIKGEWFGISKQLRSEIEACYSANYTAKQLIEKIRSNYVADRSNYVAKRSVPEVEVEVEVEEKEKEKRRLLQNSVELGVVVYNAEESILANPVQFERICVTTGKTKEYAKDSLHKYHLYLEEKEQYPKGKKAVLAGFEKWLLNEKNFQGDGKNNNQLPEQRRMHI